MRVERPGSAVIAIEAGTPLVDVGVAESHWVRPATFEGERRPPAFLGVSLCRRPGTWREVASPATWSGWARPAGEATCGDCRAASARVMPGDYRVTRNWTLGAYTVVYVFRGGRKDHLGRTSRVVASGLPEMAAIALRRGLEGP